MAVRTNSQRRQQPANPKPQEKDYPEDAPYESSTSGKKSSPFDRNRNGRIDPDDLLLGIRDTIQWVISWRGAMILAGAFTAYAASLNIKAWVAAMAVTGSGAGLAGVLVWGAIQTFELLPILDELNITASIGSLVKLQRKPLEMPVINETLNPQARAKVRRYLGREKRQDIAGEFIRYACYGLEIAVLVIGGGILSPVGVSWSGMLLAIVGICGVEQGLRLFSRCAENLLSPEEREQVRKIREAVSHSTVRL